MVITFFSAEKMLQNYNNYLTYANKLLFFCLNAIFLYITCTTLLCCNVKYAAKIQQKTTGTKVFTICALISPKIAFGKPHHIGLPLIEVFVRRISRAGRTSTVGFCFQIPCQCRQQRHNYSGY